MRALLLAMFVWGGCSDDPPESTPTPEPTAFGTPTGAAVAMTIGAGGGTIVSGDGVMTIALGAAVAFGLAGYLLVKLLALFKR